MERKLTEDVLGVRAVAGPGEGILKVDFDGLYSGSADGICDLDMIS